ncbi:hypothetical protein [Thermophilibacter provencensis]|uniref:Tetratricopeptide repeat protein n=1 Tax=Thermophilibacter provencensis TaxID=1852386 RepID=A0A921GGB5_9ACTN|nr:hypothetical protein [Thermophilibacter provencensis]HJF45573.1 hypothetical protein [Thermophilibacter provencensis]
MDLRLIGIIVVALCVISLVYTEVQKRLIFSRYEKLFEKGDFEGCLRVLDGPVVKIVYPRYNQLYMRLNAQMCLADADASRRTIDEMLELSSSDKQRLVLLLRAFNFFVEQEDYERAGELLEELREKASPEQLAGCERTYAIFAEKSAAYVDQMEAELKDATGPERTTLLYLLSVQYENKGDVKRANEYLEQVRNVFEAAVGPDAGADDGGRG